LRPNSKKSETQDTKEGRKKKKSFTKIGNGEMDKKAERKKNSTMKVRRTTPLPPVGRYNQQREKIIGAEGGKKKEKKKLFL